MAAAPVFNCFNVLKIWYFDKNESHLRASRIYTAFVYKLWSEIGHW